MRGFVASRELGRATQPTTKTAAALLICSRAQFLPARSDATHFPGKGDTISVHYVGKVSETILDDASTCNGYEDGAWRG